MNNKNIIAKLAESYDSFYLYDQRVIQDSIARLQGYFPQVDFLYSMKCNPHAEVLKTVFDGGLWADAASLGEVLMAESHGLAKEQIYYSAPGKLHQDIETALDKAVIIADSIDELHRIDEIARERGEIVCVGIRINPNFTLTGDSCAFNKFGIDEEQAIAFLQDKPCENVRVTGIHVHLKSQELCTESLIGYHQKMFALAERFDSLCGGLEYVNFGSGIGVTYANGDEDVDLAALSKSFNRQLETFNLQHPQTKVMIETGRYVSCKAGVYVTKVIDRKVSCGKTFLVLRSTLNGFVRPAMEQIFSAYGDKIAPVEPFYTCKDAFQFATLKDEAPTECVTLFGNLCTGIDAVARDIMMPHLEYGDVVVMNNAGAYAAVITPMQFSSQERPAELFLSVDGVVI